MQRDGSAPTPFTVLALCVFCAACSVLRLYGGVSAEQWVGGGNEGSGLTSGHSRKHISMTTTLQGVHTTTCF